MKWLSVVLLLAVLSGLIYWRLAEKQTAKAGAAKMRKSMMSRPVSVEMARPQYRDIVTAFTATGSVEAVQDVTISPRYAGRIAAITVREGDRVRPGQVLARLDDADTQALVRQQEASLAEARFRLAQAQLTAGATDTAVRTDIRRQDAGLGAAKADVQQAEATHVAQYAAARAQVEDAQGKIDSTTAQIANAKAGIRSQEAGVTAAQADVQQAIATRDAQYAGVIAQVDDAQGKIDSTTAQVANAKAGIRSAEANLHNATARSNRLNGLIKQGFVSTQEVEDARAAVTMQTAAVDAANGQLLVAQAALNSAQAQKKNVEQQAAVTRAKADADLASAKAKLAQAQEALEAAKGQLQVAQAALSSAQAQKRNSEQQAAILRAKADADLASAKAKLTQAQAGLEASKADASKSPAYQQSLDALRANVAAAQATLDNARARVKDTVLTSPLAGVVTARQLDAGSMAGVGQAILTVQAMQQVWVAVSAPEDVVAKLHTGQPATVVFDALGGKSFTAVIAQINPAADAASRQYTVRVLLDNKHGQLSAGMFGRVTLVTARAVHVLAVPREAVMKGKDGGSYVTVPGKDNLAEYRPVTPGPSDAQWIAVTGNLTPKDQVVTMSASPVREGKAITAGGGKKKGKGKGGPGGENTGEKTGEKGPRPQRAPGGRGE